METIGPSMVADMYFEKHYATANAVLYAFLAFGSQIGPLIVGYIFRKGLKVADQCTCRAAI